MYVCVCVYACMCVCVYVAHTINTCMHENICTYTPGANRCSCILQAYIYIYTHTHTYIHTYIHTYLVVSKSLISCVYIHIHTYIHIYIHTWLLANRCSRDFRRNSSSTLSTVSVCIYVFMYARTQYIYIYICEELADQRTYIHTYMDI